MRKCVTQVEKAVFSSGVTGISVAKRLREIGGLLAVDVARGCCNTRLRQLAIGSHPHKTSFPVPPMSGITY